MPAHQLVDEWLGEIGSTVGTALALSPEGVCVLAFDDGIDVTVEVPDDHADLVHLYSEVCTVSGGPERETLMERALMLNLFDQGTGGATLGYDQDADTLILHRSWPLDRLDSQAMADAIAAQVEAVGEVRARLAEASGGMARRRHDDPGGRRAGGEEHPPDPSFLGVRG